MTRCDGQEIQAEPGLNARQAIGFVYIPDGDGINEVYGDCAMTPAYFHEHWGQYLDPIDFLADPKRFWQAVMLARKR